jgi:hypothetical protein
MNLSTTTTTTTTTTTALAAGTQEYYELWIWLGQGNKVHTQNVSGEISWKMAA